MKCYVCGKSTGSRKRYCPHCRKFLVKGSGDRLKRRAAMIEAYDIEADAFRCYYTR